MPKCENKSCNKETNDLFFYSYDTAENSYQDILICKKCIKEIIPSANSKKYGKVILNRNNSRYGGAVNSAFNKS